MGKTWSWDSPWDVYAMSNYNTITSLAESPKQEGLIYAGTDDGRIQVTENGGESWRKIEVGDLPGIPKTAFVNDIKADLFDANTVYVVLDNHKYGDLNPYLVKSNDKGKTWKSIKSNLPEKTLLWRIVQDHLKPELMFLGTEFGIYFTLSGGEEWIKIKGGVPTISFRDLAIQKRENDLVGASFGRGFYVFDDYSFLRELNPSDLKNKEAEIFTGRDALWFLPRGGHGFSEKGSQGAGYFTADNPPYGATFTYYLADSYKTKKQIRQETEKKLLKENKVITFPGWENVEAERTEEEPTLWLTIKDSKENVVRKIEAKNKKGFNRVSWNLRYPSYSAIDSQKDLPKTERGGILAQPGNYTATLSKQIAGEITDIAGPKSFTVKKLKDGTLKGNSSDEILVYSKNVTELQKKMTASSIKLQKATKKIKSLQYVCIKNDRRE